MARCDEEYFTTKNVVEVFGRWRIISSCVLFFDALVLDGCGR